MPIIYQDDVERITFYTGGYKPPFLCYINSRNADRGTCVDASCLVEYTIRSPISSHEWMRPPMEWVRVQSIMKPHYSDPVRDYRLSGMWMRPIMYTATAPDNLGLLYLAETFPMLKDSLPHADVRDTVPQPAYGPSDPGTSGIAPTLYIRGLMDVPR
jgi:hypothetical protein